MDSWIAIAHDCHFSLQNLPYGVFKKQNSEPRIGTAIGKYVLDLKILSENGVFNGLGIDTTALGKPELNHYAKLGKAAHRAVRQHVQDLLKKDTKLSYILRDNNELKKKALHLLEDVIMELPFKIGEYTDFFAGLSHAQNCIDIILPGKQLIEAFPSFFDLPTGYGGRASSIVVSETPFHRPQGQIAEDGKAIASACQRLDFEVELAAFIAQGNNHGAPISIEEAEEHIFGVVLLNDWSARDIQMFECYMIGPLNGKNFCTSISPWVVPLEALESFRTRPQAADRELVHYMEHSIESVEYHVGESNMNNLAFSLPQLLVHHTRGGCPMRTGDLIATGTLSGPSLKEYGCLLEMSKGGKDAASLKSLSGEMISRTFLEDGDTVEITALLTRDGGLGNVGFGAVRGRVLPAKQG